MKNPLSGFVTLSNRITFLSQSDSEMSSNSAVKTSNGIASNKSTSYY